MAVHVRKMRTAGLFVFIWTCNLNTSYSFLVRAKTTSNVRHGIPLVPTSKFCLRATPNITKTTVNINNHVGGLAYVDEKGEQYDGNHHNANSNYLEEEDQGRQTQGLDTHSTVGTQINSEINDYEEWDLDEDWILIDQVPLFTVHSSRKRSNTAVTFWTQLRHSVPQLSCRSEEELEKRYRILYDQNVKLLTKEYANHDIDSLVVKKTRITTKEMIQGGASPEFLTDWWMEEHSHSSSSSTTSGDGGIRTMMVGGALMNGRKIWFPLNYAGKLYGISNHDGDDDDRKYETPSFDYAEAIGGSIYELGTQRKITSKQGGTQLNVISDKIAPSPSVVQPWSLSKYGSIFAAVISSIAVSALVVFSLFLDPPLIHHQISSSSQDVNGNSIPTGVVVNDQRSQLPLPSSSSSPSSTAISSAGASTEANELSISGQRARQELRIERDRKTIARIQEKLKFDETKLQELQKEETREQAIEYGFAK